MFNKLRIPFMAVAFSAVAMTATPTTASAQASCAASVTLGFGGFFSGCWDSFDVARLFENAGDVSNMYWFAGMPATDAVTNAPTPSGSLLFNNDCGSSGANATTGQFCVPTSQTNFSWGFDLELVFGLNNTAKNTWLYSGLDPNRNDPPAPAGVQNWLWEVVGGTYDGWYLFGWEDLNSGCTFGTSIGGAGSLGPNQVDGTGLDAAYLGANVVNCTSVNSGNTADNDYNDFYVLVNPHLDPGTPGEVVPEPMTMTLLATGLLGMGGASAARRRRKS